MSEKHFVDPACRALAEHFYPKATHAQLRDLAELFQSAAEDFGLRVRAQERKLPRLVDAVAAVSPEAGVDMLERLNRRIRRAEIAYAKALVELYPVNSKAIYLMNGKHRIACTVIGHRSDRIKIRSRSGVERYVRGCQVVPRDRVDASE